MENLLRRVYLRARWHDEQRRMRRDGRIKQVAPQTLIVSVLAQLREAQEAAKGVGGKTETGNERTKSEGW